MTFLVSSALGLYLAAAVCPWVRPGWLRVAQVLSVAAVALVAGSIALHWAQLGYAPLRTFHQTYVVVAFWLSVLGTVALMRRQRLPASSAFLVGAGVLGWAFLHPDLELSPLPPALQSAWFVPHVTVYLLGYGTLLVAAALAAVGSVKPAWRDSAWAHMSAYAHLAFLFLTLGLLMGSLWADEVWGTWWAWDPKESWTFVTWLALAALLHIPQIERQRRLGAVLVVTALGLTLVTYLGMHLIPTAADSKHLYARKAEQATPVTENLARVFPDMPLHLPIGQRPFVLNVIASWCGPCKAEQPLLNDLSTRVPVYGIFWRDTPEKARAYIREQKATFAAVGLDTNGDFVTDMFGTRTVPQTFVFDKAGNRVGHLSGPLTPERRDGELADLLKKAGL
jgi:ABC-type transport system involved in cytochrome c biogenesis permease subunit